MKKLLLFFFVAAFVSCNSDDKTETKDFTEENEKEIVEYINKNGLDAQRTNSGLYFVIDELGEGADVKLTSDVSLRYKASLTNGQIIEENMEEGLSFNLQQVMIGLREGLQYFNEGGSGTILIPAHLGYGNDDYNGVPGGSVLIFDVELIDYQAENDQEIIQFLQDNNLEAEKSETGLYYIISEQGEGLQPNENSIVTVAYRGYFTDLRIFDQSTAAGIPFELNKVIKGWQEGIQYFKEGGKGKLFIPSSLAYGRYGNQSIPGGTVLIFDIELKSVN